MRRFRKHKVKEEKSEASTSHSWQVNEYDLTYYIHDRVELMHQVFSVLKDKDLKAMAPECVRHISIDDLQELCTEELLGISSKRLCAILDGADPPSDTDSSSESPERFETISLDSISSDEEILSETSKKSKKHKRHRRDSRTKSKKKKNKVVEEVSPVDAEKTKASRAGLTVLELLELQARARAIRAQLQQEQAAKQAAAPARVSGTHSSDNEVEIKEEPAEVVEISSEDEKPKIEDLREKTTSKPAEPQKPPDDAPETQAVAKRINDLVITVPQVKKSRKIKLNRSKITVSVDNNETTGNHVVAANVTKNVVETKKQSKSTEANEKSKDKEAKLKEKVSKTKDKKKKSKKVDQNQDSDHDEITLQLSDTEKMDLLEDLDRKNFEKLSSSDSEDSESSSSDSDSHKSNLPMKSQLKQNKDIINDKEITEVSNKVEVINENHTTSSNDVEMIVEESMEKKSPTKPTEQECLNTPHNVSEQTHKNDNKLVETHCSKKICDENSITNDNLEITSINDIPIVEDKQKDDSASVTRSPVSQETDLIHNSVETNTGNKKDSPKNDSKSNAGSPTEDAQPTQDILVDNVEKQNSIVSINSSSADQTVIINQTVQVETIDNSSQESANEKDNDKELSDGELSDKESSEIEAVEVKAEIVCISDDETDKKSQKKKKKKEKKSKTKKSKKSKQDFREGDDQNFYKETDTNCLKNTDAVKVDESISLEDNDYDDVYEILELSDDSSCYEVEGTVLSKEPTAKEIEDLSAKIDEIEREDVVTEEEIREHERRNEQLENLEELENISWKDRYLDSKKVKKVLSTSSIFNALRKKNRELKKKIEESKKIEEIAVKKIVVEKTVRIEEGSIEQYNTLEGLTRYVDPVLEATKTTDGDVGKEKNNEEVAKNGENAQNEEITNNGESIQTDTPPVTKEIRKDAKQLLKMYKRLMKYNDMNRQKDPNKRKDPNKKKKSKKKNNNDGNVTT